MQGRGGAKEGEALWEKRVEGEGGRRAVDLHLKRCRSSTLGSVCNSYERKQGRERWRRGRLGWGRGTWAKAVGGEQ